MKLEFLHGNDAIESRFFASLSDYTVNIIEITGILRTVFSRTPKMNTIIYSIII